MVKTLRFRAALLSTGWASDVWMEIDELGWIKDLKVGKSDVAQESFDQVALPGMTNVHSHAFQRAFAGSTEYRIAERDSFWTWREKMFKYVRTLTPEQVYEIAKGLYAEMLMAGYTWVGEFHYLHGHDGNRDSVDHAMCRALARAAVDSGIGFCLLPTLYQRGGFDNRPLSSGQSRFYLSEDRFLELFRLLQSEFISADTKLGAALHSLRAVDDQTGNRVVAALKKLSPELPIHMHVAEQSLEVEDCLKVHARTPIRHLLDTYPIDPHWCLIHGTQGSVEELHAVVQTGAVVCLCPTTEGNLGDGIFAAKEFMERGGRIALGSDSHCSIDVREEIRWLEYSQRYRLRERAVLCGKDCSVGHHLYKSCAENGGRAIGVRTGVLDVGYRADLVLVEPGDDFERPLLEVQGHRLLDQYIFCNHPRSKGPSKVMVGGRWISATEIDS